MTEQQLPLIDWATAAGTGARLVPRGPAVSPDEARAAVTQLRAGAARAAELVGEYTGLNAPPDPSAVRVVDRPGWIEANVADLRTLVGPLEDRMRRVRPTPGLIAQTVTPRLAGAETGALLAFLAVRVLGQYELVPPTVGTDATAVATSRLLLVAPNVVAVERGLAVDPTDFRLWVCLHEETHRTQFTAVPWLRDYLLGQINTYLETLEMDPAAVARQVRDGVVALGRTVGRAVSGRDPGEGPSLLEAVQTPAQREVLDRLTAVMSLVEGHAEVVMDEVGRAVVPSVATIRARFSQRRATHGVVDLVVRQLLGLDAKMRQYADGAVFVRGVLDQAGREGLDAVWAGPQNLPTVTELADPGSWLRRVHG